MRENFSIESNAVHLWRANLTDLIAKEGYFLELLSPDELERAYRFKFEKHRQRFAIARGILREILSLYTNLAPEEILFIYGPRGKPELQDNDLRLQFNVSHSEEVAIYGFTKNIPIGVDIQKIEDEYNDGIAKRFFNESEYNQLSQLAEHDRATAFCQLWTYKEALIKTLGEGLFVSLERFIVDLHKDTQRILLTHNEVVEEFYLEKLAAFSGFCSAFATTQPIAKKEFWEF